MPYVQPGELPRRLFEALRLLLLELVVSAPVVLFLDDLQWADETTIAALEYIRRRWKGGRLTLVLTLRPEGLSPSSRIGRFIGDLKGRPGVERLELTELSLEAAEALVREVAVQSLTPNEQRSLASLGGQVPFFVIELVQEHDAGRLDPQPIEGEHIPIPLSIQQVLEQRLTNLPPPADLVLKALAVYGHPAGVIELTQLAEIPAETCVAALEQLHDFRLVHWTAGGVLLRHQLIRHAVYAGTGEASRRWLHGKVAEYLQLQKPPPVDQLALHYHRAGMHDQALKFALEAADKAEFAGGVPEALGYLGIARCSTEEPLHTTNIIGKLAHLNYLHRNFAEAGPLLTLAVENFRNQNRIAEALNAETERVDTLSQQESLPAGSLKELKRIKVDARAHGFWGVVAKALDVEVHIRGRVGDIVGVIETLEEAETCLIPSDPVSRCFALCSLAINIFYGSPDRALESARQAVRVAEEHGLKGELFRAQNRLILVMIQLGLLNSVEAKRVYSQALLAAVQSGDLFSKFNLHANMGVWLLDIGKYDQASAAFEQAATVIQDSEARASRRMLLYNTGELHFHRDEVAEAERLINEAQALIDPGTPVSVSATIHAGLGLCALHQGNLGRAREMEAALPPDPVLWFYEPSTVATFRARLLASRGRVTDAVDYLGSVADSIQGRLVTSWIKVKMEQIRLVRKLDKAKGARLAEEVLPLASDLGLTERVHEADRFKG